MRWKKTRKSDKSEDWVPEVNDDDPPNEVVEAAAATEEFCERLSSLGVQASVGGYTIRPEVTKYHVPVRTGRFKK